VLAGKRRMIPLDQRIWQHDPFPHPTPTQSPPSVGSFGLVTCHQRPVPPLPTNWQRIIAEAIQQSAVVFRQSL
jgi:hypothetical protein